MVKVIKLPKKKGKPEGKQCLLDKVKTKFLPKPKGVKVSSDEIVEILKKEIGDYDYIVLLADDYYNCLSYDDYIKFLKSDRVNQEKWIENVHDCDNFALELAGNASQRFRLTGCCLGELWFYHVKEGWGHAINFFITSDKQFWCVEPQNDKVFKFDKENWKCIMVKLC